MLIWERQSQNSEPYFGRPENDFSRRKWWEKGRGREPKMDGHLPGAESVAFIFPSSVTRKSESKA